MEETINIILRSIILLIISFFLFKLMGKKQVSQMNMFDYVSGITLGSIIADISLDIEKNILGGLSCLLIYSFANVIISYLCIKSIKIRNFINGKEIYLIKEGNLLSENLYKNKITINMLETEARSNGYFDLSKIDNSILETNGKISFEPKDQQATQKDLAIKKKNNLVYNIIIDKELIEENLKEAKITKKWLEQQLKILGKKQENILLLTIDTDKNIKIYEK